jgi:deoxyribonuclease IV
MYKLGLKLWSTNNNYIKESLRLYDLKTYQYIELFIVPGSYEKFATLWKKIKIPYIIHAPHSACGLNFAKRSMLKTNFQLAQETFVFAKALNASNIIFHPGTNGKIEETIYQLQKIVNPFNHKILIENKPYYSLNGKKICIGNSPEEIKLILKNSDIGFCLDIGHAIYAANAKKINPLKYIKQFIKLSPQMYHLTDGNYNGIYDEHEHIGKGNFNFNNILKLIPKNSIITIETKKDSKNNLHDFKVDIEILKNTYYY